MPKKRRITNKKKKHPKKSQRFEKTQIKEQEWSPIPGCHSSLKENPINDKYGFLKNISRSVLEIPDSFTLHTSEFGFQPCRLVEEKKLIEAIPDTDLLLPDSIPISPITEEEQGDEYKEVFSKEQADTLMDIDINPEDFNNYMSNFFKRVQMYHSFDQLSESIIILRLTNSILSKIYRLRNQFGNANENILYELFAAEISKILIKDEYAQVKNYTHKSLTNKFIETKNSIIEGIVIPDKTVHAKSTEFNKPFTHFSSKKSNNNNCNSYLNKAETSHHLQPTLFKKRKNKSYIAEDNNKIEDRSRKKPK
jgi:hypothetical protein